MAVTPTPVFPQTIVCASASATTGNTQITTTPIACVTAGTNGTKIDALWITNTLGQTYPVSFYWATTTSGGPISCVTVAASAGAVTNVPHTDILRSSQFPGLAYDAFGNKIMYLASGTVLSFTSASAVTTGQLSVFAQGAHF